MSTEFELEPGVEVKGRFRIESALPVAGSRRAFQALDSSTGRSVSLFRISAAEARALGPLTTLEHAHLARVIEVPELGDGSHLLVFEDVAGPRLDTVLDAVGHETPLEAVRSALRVADALSALHHAGAVHGFLHPASVIVAPEGRKPPLLTFAPPPDPPSAFHSSAHARDPTPSVADDTWGMTALFHFMLVGNAPPSTGFEDEAPFEQAGVKDPVLRAALLHGLHADESRRATDLTPLRRELARWLVDRAGDESSGPIKTSTPPPLPITEKPAATRESPAPQPIRRWSRGLVLGTAGAAFLVALAAVWALSVILSRRVEVVEVPSAAPSAPASDSAARIDLTEVSVTTDAGPNDETAQCASGLLREGTFGPKLPDFRWLCSEPDPRTGALRLRSALVAGRPQGAVTDAMRIVSQFGWYELAAYAVVYRGCCPDAPALKLPDPGPGCPRVDSVLEQVATAVVSERPLDPALQSFSAALDCETRANRAAVYRQKGRPKPIEEAGFRVLFKLPR